MYQRKSYGPELKKKTLDIFCDFNNLEKSFSKYEILEKLKSRYHIYCCYDALFSLLEDLKNENILISKWIAEKIIFDPKYKIPTIGFLTIEKFKLKSNV